MVILKCQACPALHFESVRPVSDPNSSAADISRMIQADPAMVGRLNQVVNRAAFKSEKQIDRLSNGNYGTEYHPEYGRKDLH